MEEHNILLLPLSMTQNDKELVPLSAVPRNKFDATFLKNIEQDLSTALNYIHDHDVAYGGGLSLDRIVVQVGYIMQIIGWF